jgi:hypothetical protein
MMYTGVSAMLNPTLGHARVVRMAIQAFFLEVMGSIKL